MCCTCMLTYNTPSWLLICCTSFLVRLVAASLVLAQADPSVGDVNLNSTQRLESLTNPRCNQVKILESDAGLIKTAGQLLTTGALVLLAVV